MENRSPVHDAVVVQSLLEMMRDGHAGLRAGIHGILSVIKTQKSQYIVGPVGFENGIFVAFQVCRSSILYYLKAYKVFNCIAIMQLVTKFVVPMLYLFLNWSAYAQRQRQVSSSGEQEKEGWNGSYLDPGNCQSEVPLPLYENIH